MSKIIMDKTTYSQMAIVDLIKYDIPGGLISVQLFYFCGTANLSFMLFIGENSKPHSVVSCPIDNLTLDEIQKKSKEISKKFMNSANKIAIFGQFIKTAVEKGFEKTTEEEKSKIYLHTQSLKPLPIPFEWNDPEGERDW